ncbi:hypothetical protein QTP88_005562 [Uroleucon formosanum]
MNNYPKSARHQGSLISFIKSKQRGPYSSQIINLQNLSKTYSSIRSTNLETLHLPAYVDQDRGLPKHCTTYYNRCPLPAFNNQNAKTKKPKDEDTKEIEGMTSSDQGPSRRQRKLPLQDRD